MVRAIRGFHCFNGLPTNRFLSAIAPQAPIKAPERRVKALLLADTINLRQTLPDRRQGGLT
jgi:hypothetical protein